MPAIIIQSLDQAVAALKEHLDAPTEIYLLSPKNAAATMGAAVFLAMVGEAAKQVPGRAFTAVLDCGENPGYALAAIRAGAKAIVFSASKTTPQISDIARQHDCQVFTRDIYNDVSTG